MGNPDGMMVLITGASGGLGTSVTQAFLRKGATVAGMARSNAGLDFEGDFEGIAVDLSSAGATRSAVDRVLDTRGRIDVLVHLVGGFAPGTTAETSADVFTGMFDVNVRSAFNAIQAVLPGMRKAGAGRIIATGSKAALEPSPGAAIYAASKAALVSLIRTVAAENQDRGITANIVLPATIDTPANRAAMPKADFSRWVQPSEIADLMVFLASRAAGAISGAAIPVYGGAAE